MSTAEGPGGLLPPSMADEARRVEVVRLADAVREVIHRMVATTAPVDVFHGVADDLEAVAARLAAYPQNYLYSGRSESSLAAGVDVDTGGPFDNSPLLGAANPLAPPMQVEIEGDRVHGHVTCGAAYEGPPGCVHGGIVAAIFDELLGLGQSLSGRMGMTGKLAVWYRSPTPLHTPLALEARLKQSSGRKTVVHGTIRAGDTLCAEAEGLFISIDPEKYQQLKEARDGAGGD